MPTNVTMSPELLVMVVSAILALAFRHVPKLNTWYTSLVSEAQAGIMALLLLIVALTVFLANCGQFLVVVNLTCTKQGALDALWYLFLALNTNQATYMIAVRPFNQK